MTGKNDTMGRAVRRGRSGAVTGAVVAALVSGLAVAAPGPAVAAEITVSAEGRATVAPDMATLRLGVRERAETAQAALQATSDATAALLEVLSGAGVAGDDIQTSELSLQPVWRGDRDGQEITPQQFEAANTVTVQLRDLDAVGEVVSAAVAAGANRFEGLSFGVTDMDDALDRARRAAVAEALRRGVLLAEAAGIAPPPVQRIIEDGAQAPRPMALRSAEMDMGASPPIAPGELTVSARVTVVFAEPPE
ncbi:MAG: SIMPL domain-containing protein [Alkalilacustris sp.]